MQIGSSCCLYRGFFFLTLLIADSLDLTGQTYLFEFHILHSELYNSIITVETNECTELY